MRYCGVPKESASQTVQRRQPLAHGAKATEDLPMIAHEWRMDGDLTGMIA